jgi:methionine synthase I (cobalamin-dependent)/5,10-methylenetetrahydrofolate reductase
MSKKFLEQLAKKPLLCDGAMGTVLYSKGITFEKSFDVLNLTNPALVAEVHREYIEAGADIIQTNTFGANRVKLAAHRLDDQVGEINRAAVNLARRVIDASFKEVMIAGSVGPLGTYLAPLGRLQPESAFAVYKGQIEALVEAGVDLLLFETFSDLSALEQGLAAARAVDADIPIVAQVTFANDGLTPLGDTPAQVAEFLLALQPDVMGVNCSVGPARVLRSIHTLAQHLPQGTLLSAQPNAGWPHRRRERLMYPASPDYFAEYAANFIAAGVSLVGGCCGTTPDHIAKMRSVLDKPITKQSIISITEVISTDEATPTPDPLEPTGLAKKLAAGEFISSVEIHPPRGSSVAKVMATTRILQEAGVSVVNVADMPVARMRMSPWAVCHLIQSELGLETILNFPTRGRNLLRIQGDLLAAHALNIRNLFVVMGDPTTIGDYPEAFNHHDVVSTGLIRLVKHGFNARLDYAGNEISEPTNFVVGCALNLNPPKIEREINLLKKKIDSGADFAMTQVIYDPQELDTFVQRYEAVHGPLKLPLILSVLPLYNAGHAEFLHNEVPGIFIPEALRDQLRRAGDHATQTGIAMATDLILSLKDKIQGVYIMPPFQRYYLAAEIIERLQPEVAAMPALESVSRL